MTLEMNAQELEDAHRILGIEEISSLQVKDGVSLYLGTRHHETLTLTSAVYRRASHFQEKVNLILRDFDSGGLFLFDGKGFRLCAHPSQFDFSMYESSPLRTSAIGNALGFKKYTDNKAFTSVILRMNGIRVSEELIFKKRQNTSGSNRGMVSRALQEIGDFERYVLKPVDGGCGDGVRIFTQEEVLSPGFYDEFISGMDTLLLQGKIDSYPITIDGRRKDWNLRVLVTYDVNLRKYVPVGITGRIDDDGGPVNVSIKAECISLEEISKLAGWTREQYDVVLRDVNDIAVRSVGVIKDRIAQYKEPFMMHFDHQVLAGVDVIISEDLTPSVIEVNGANSGGAYQVMKFRGIEAVYPIADSIITKAKIASMLFRNK